MHLDMLLLLRPTPLAACLSGGLAVLMIAVLLASPAAAVPAAAAPVADHDDDVSDPYLGRLLDEINKRRDAIGTQHLAYIPASANAALDGFLAQTLPAMAWPRPCQHHLASGSLSWDYVRATGFDGEARGEVMACPGPEPYWTPDRVAEHWWESPTHFSVLYADPDANGLACSASGLKSVVVTSKGKRKGSAPVTVAGDAADAVLCVTFRD
jgi:hypothetical protein